MDHFPLWIISLMQKFYILIAFSLSINCFSYVLQQKTLFTVEIIKLSGFLWQETKAKYISHYTTVQVILCGLLIWFSWNNLQHLGYELLRKEFSSNVHKLENKNWQIPAESVL